MSKVFNKVLLKLLLFTSFLSIAQQYPVQVTHQMLAPYGIQLSDYSNSSNVRFRLNLLMTDISVVNRPVKLKLHIKGGGLDIHSVDDVIGAQPVFLNGGSLTVLTNLDLAAYFQPQNLQGINFSVYSRPLPEGVYQFCWEVYDAYSGYQISHPNLGCAQFFLSLNDPPFLNLPNRGDQIEFKDPTNIIFTWTPRHTNATNVSYDFELRELWDNQIDPQAAFLSSSNYYTETTNATSLLYSMSNPVLLPEKRYAWRVRAKSGTGINKNNLIFKNDGYSEIYYFTYTEKCGPPKFVLAESKGKKVVKIQWEALENHKEFHVQYKRTDIPGAEWFEIKTYNQQVQLRNLQPGKTYTFRVGGNCNELTEMASYSYTIPSTFTMPDKTEKSYTCGIVPEIKINNTTPLQSLGVNETFTAGDFPVTVKEIRGGNGNFTGRGYIVVPYLADTRIAVIFNNVKINTDYQLYGGTVATTYDETWGGVSDVNELFVGGAGNAESSEVNFEIKDVVIKPDGTPLVIGKDGEIVELTKGEDYTITEQIVDPETGETKPGNAYQVDEQGNVTGPIDQASGGATNMLTTSGVNPAGEAEAITTKGVVVRFKKDPEEKLGFDIYKKSCESIEGTYRKLSDDYYMPYQAVAKGKEARIIAEFTIDNDSVKPSDIIFKTKEGIAIKKVDSTKNSYTLALKGTFDDAEIETQALVRQGKKYNVAGAFVQYQASLKPVTIVLVNTDSYSTAPIKQALKEIYAQAMIDLTFKEINDFGATLEELTPNGIISSGESGFAAQYTKQQQDINRALKEHSVYKANPEAYYLILTSKDPSTKGQPNNEKGIMPIGRQFGYIYMNKADAFTAAHELGHGAFQLKHPFSELSYGCKEPTGWLMDYDNGNKIPFVHWKEMHNPKLRIGIFDDDSEGELSGRTFLTADWIPFTFKNESKIISPSKPMSVVDGAIRAIYHNEVIYKSNGNKFTSDNGKDLEGISYKKTLKPNEDVYLFKYIEPCYSELYKTKWSYAQTLKGKTKIDYSHKKFTKKVLAVCPNKDQTKKGNCKDYALIDKDKDKINTYQLKVNKALEESLVGIEGLKDYEERSKGSFNHIQFVNVKDSDILEKTENLEIIEDKLHLLTHYTKDTYMVVTFLKLEPNTTISKGQLSSMADVAINKVGVNGRKILNLIISFSDYESIFGVGLFNNKSCYSIGYAQSDNTIIQPSQIKTGKTPFLDIISYFSNIEKPLNIYKTVVRSDFKVVNLLQKNNKRVRGQPLINALGIFKSKHLKEIEQLRLKKPENVKSSATKAEKLKYEQEYFEWKLAFDKLKLNSLADDEKAIAEKKLSKFDYVEGGKIDLREVYITENSAVTGLLTDYSMFHYDKIEHLSILVNTAYILDAYNKLDSQKHLYEGNIETKNVIYDLLDTGSLILSPIGADVIFDVIGVFYAGANGDYLKAGEFSLGVTLVGATQGIKHLRKFKLIRNVDKNQVKYTIKELDAVVDGIVVTDKNNKPIEFIGESIDNIATQFKFDGLIIKTVDNLDFVKAVDNLSDDAIVLGKNLETATSYLKNADSPKYLDVLVHGDGHKFFIDGKVGTHKDLAKIIGEGDKPIRLLSCSSLKSAQDLANKTGRKVIACEGNIKLYNNGAIKSENKWYELLPGNKKNDYNITQAKWKEPIGGKSITLGKNLANSVDDLMNGGKLFGKFSRGKFLEVISKKQKLFGGNKILLSSNRTTTITGSLSDVNVVARRGENLSGVTKMGQNVGGINILRSPKWSKIITKHTRNEVTDWAKVSDEFWNTVNKPWLDDAIKRGDNFRFVSDPSNEVAKYVNEKGKFILDVNGNKIKSIFWREFEYLKSKGYRLMSDGTLSK